MADPKHPDPKHHAPAAHDHKPKAHEPAAPTHYVVLHHLNAWEPGQVIEAAALPVVEDQPAEIQRLIDLRAMRPASEDEAKEKKVKVGLWEGRAPRAGAQLVISRADVDEMRQRIRTLEAERGNPEELRALRERVKELEGLMTADKGASVPVAKGKPGE